MRRAAPAWVAAIDGADDQLLRVATPAGAQALLSPDTAHPRARFVMRGGAVEAGRVAELRHASPARVRAHDHAQNRSAQESGACRDRRLGVGCTEEL